MNLDDEFFQSVYAADIEAEDEPDSEESFQSIHKFLVSAQRSQSAVRRTTTNKPALRQIGSNALSAGRSSLKPGVVRRIFSMPQTVAESNSRQKREEFSPPKLKASSSAPPRATSIMPRATLKRQKTNPTIPEERQFFRGRKYYFLPDDKKNGVRRMRIEKFEEYGGTWIEHWNVEVDVVVLDAHLKYGDLLKYLKLDQMPETVHVVTERYITDCLQFRGILNPQAICYRVRDAPDIEIRKSESITQKETPPSSLEIKSIQRKHPRTPSPAGADRQSPDGLLLIVDPNKPKDQDELSLAMAEARSMADLMIEDPDDVPVAGDSDENVEVKNWKPARFTKHQDSFSCMHKSTGSTSTDNPNAQTIKILEEMGRHYDRVHDNWRTQAYRKAITQLKRQTKKISTEEEAKRLPGVGTRLAGKIEEIVITNRLRRLDNVNDEPLDKVYTLFLGIYGVGLSQASRWIQAGHRTLEDLTKKVKLTTNQQIGVEHYDDFQQRIPRAEVEQHGEIVRKALLKLDPHFQVTIGGSYRRGAETSGDIDLIVTKPGATSTVLKAMVMDDLVPRLFKADFFKVSLASASQGDSTGSKFHGCSSIPGSKFWRRIDLLLVPWEELGAALIYFTGNDVFNRSIRLLARQKGLRLNQCGLFKNVVRDTPMRKMNEGELVESKSEKRIFEILGVPWRPPQDRIC